MVLRYAVSGRQRFLTHFCANNGSISSDECARLKQHFEAMTKDSKVSIRVGTGDC